MFCPSPGPGAYSPAIAIGLLAGVLNGASLGVDAVDFTADAITPTNTGQFVAAIDIAAFGNVDAFTATATRVFAEMPPPARR